MRGLAVGVLVGVLTVPSTSRAAPPPPQTPAGAKEPAKNGGALVAAGAVLVGVGVALVGVGIAGAVMGAQANEIGPNDEVDYDVRGEQFQRGRAGNTMAIVGTVGAPLFLGAGVALLVLGKRHEKSAAHASVMPSLGWSGAGVVLRARF